MPIVVGIITRRIKDKLLGDTGHHDLKIGDRVVIETEHGLETGVVYEKEKQVDKPKDPVVKIVRKVSQDDMRRLKENEEKNIQAHKAVMSKIEDHELAMKLTCVQYTFDRSKLFIYYTAEARVDFRELIKDLGHILKTRIQMVQIGVRDEAKMIGGIGHCGRVLCCKQFLKDFSSVTIDMAKDQDLSLNTTKLSGLCGRLMCCLSYEHECYKNSRKKFPPHGSKVATPDGPGNVLSSNIIKEEVTVAMESKDNKDTRETKTYKLDQLSYSLNDKQNKGA